MRDFEQELQEYGLTRETYEACLKDIQDKIVGLNDMDWKEIVDKYNLSIHYDTLRKASQTIFGNAFVMDYFKEKQSLSTEDITNGYLADLKQTKIELNKERQKIRDEKLEFNKWIREQARDELICEKICDAIKSIEPMKPLNIKLKANDTNKEAVLCFADTHYGCEFTIKGLFGEIINEYSPEIFEQRMQELLNDVIEVIKEKNLKKIRVFSLGDELDGILRVSQLQKLKYGIIESTIKYSEFICNWLSKLTEYVFVDFYSVQGNHTELRLISQPKGTFTQENMSFVINEFIKERLKNNYNFKFHTNDTGLIFENVSGFNVLGIHGEVKNMETALQQFSNTYKTPIDILVAGHKHHFASETVGQNKEVINVPSVIGIDDYSMSLGKTSNAGALMFVVEPTKGVTEQRFFKF